MSLLGKRRANGTAPSAKKPRGEYRRKYSKVPKVPAVELKFHDVDVDDAIIAANGTIAAASVLTIAQGDTEVQRIGRKITIRKIQWRYNIKLIQQTVSSATGDIVRVVLYQDRQTNGAAAAVTDIMESDNYQSFLNLANSDRFFILHDKTFEVNATAGGGDGTTEDYGLVEKHHTVYKECNIKIQYDDSVTTGAIGSMRSNNIGVLLLSKNGVCAFDSKMRFRFSDP